MQETTKAMNDELLPGSTWRHLIRWSWVAIGLCLVDTFLPVWATSFGDGPLVSRWAQVAAAGHDGLGRYLLVPLAWCLLLFAALRARRRRLLVALFLLATLVSVFDRYLTPSSDAYTVHDETLPLLLWRWMCAMSLGAVAAFAHRLRVCGPSRATRIGLIAGASLGMVGLGVHYFTSFRGLPFPALGIDVKPSARPEIARVWFAIVAIHASSLLALGYAACVGRSGSSTGARYLTLGSRCALLVVPAAAGWIWFVGLRQFSVFMPTYAQVLGGVSKAVQIALPFLCAALVFDAAFGRDARADSKEAAFE